MKYPIRIQLFRFEIHLHMIWPQIIKNFGITAIIP